VQLVQNGRLKTYKGLPHGCHSTHPDLINADILGFIRGEEVGLPAETAPAIIAEPLPLE
jgi:non-heme chloroperoxidase